MRKCKAGWSYKCNYLVTIMDRICSQVCIPPQSHSLITKSCYSSMQAWQGVGGLPAHVHGKAVGQCVLAEICAAAQTICDPLGDGGCLSKMIIE
jgi:hypothetical protein